MNIEWEITNTQLYFSAIMNDVLSFYKAWLILDYILCGLRRSKEDNHLVLVVHKFIYNKVMYVIVI